VSRRVGTLGRSRQAAAASSTLDAVLDAAQLCFARYGIAQTTVDDVVRVAKVPRATLYRHAGGKEALVEAVSLRQLDRFLAQLVEHVAGFDEFEDQIVEAVLFTIEHYRSDDLLKLVLAAGRLPEGRRLLKGMEDQLRGRLERASKPWLEAARQAGKLRPDVDVRDYVEWTTRVIESLVRLPPEWPRAREREFLARMLVPAFVPDAAR
jgi:AcrR family transcriptional regulator